MVSNLVGSWLGARLGLNRTMNIGLALQVIATGTTGKWADSWG